MAYIDHNHASMLGTYLSCPNCHTPRVAKRGVIQAREGQLQSIWYLGCECAKPAGVL